MKVKKLFSTVTTILLLFMASMSANGQTTWIENFDYPQGDLYQQGNWVRYASEKASPIQVDNDSLKVDGFESGSTHSVRLTATPAGEDLMARFTTDDTGITQGTVYALVLFRLDTAPSAPSYFFSLLCRSASRVITDGKIFPNIGRIFTDKGSSEQTYKIGIERGGTEPVWKEQELNIGTTYLAVLKYEFGTAGSKKDGVWLYINPTSHIEEPAEADATFDPNSTSTAANKGLQGVLLSQTATTSVSSPVVTVAGLRMSTTYADLFVAPQVTPVLTVSPKTYSFGKIYADEQKSFDVKLKGSNLNGSVNVVSDNPSLVPSVSTISKEDVENGATVSLRLSPSADNENNANVTFSSDGAEDVKVAVSWEISERPTAETLPDTPIYDQPEGTFIGNVVKHSLSWTADDFGNLSTQRSEFAASKLVKGENGAVYLYNPFGAKTTKTWLKGYTANNDTVVFRGPQHIADISIFDFKLDDGYAVKMKLNSEGTGYMVDSTDTDIHMVWKGDTLKWAEPEDGTVILAFVDSENQWQQIGDFNYEIYPQTDKANNVPEDADFERYLLKSASGIEMVNVAVKDNDIYVKGFSSIESDLALKGTLHDGKAVFADGQYLGVDSLINFHIYAFATDSTTVTDSIGNKTETLKWANTDLTFDYDAQAKTLTQADHGFIINVGKFRPYYIRYYKHPELSLFVEKAIKPTAPKISSGADIDEDLGYGHVVFGISSQGENGEYLLPDKVYYLVSVDNTPIQSKDDNEEYNTFFASDSTPWDENYTIVNYHNGWREFQFYDEINTVTFQTVYLGGGEETYSDKVTFNVKTGETTDVIKTVENRNNKPVAIYDISGRKLQQTSKGLNIVRTADGKTLKIFK